MSLGQWHYVPLKSLHLINEWPSETWPPKWRKWADWTLWDWTRDAEVAVGVLDEVGPHHLKNMHILGGKTERADAPWSQQKTPCKKNSREAKKIFFGRCCCWTCSGRARTWEKIDLKKDWDRKNRLKELLYTTQMAHWYGGSKINKTSNSSNNNSNFRGSGLSGPPVTMGFMDQPCRGICFYSKFRWN